MQVAFDRRIRVQFHGVNVTSDAELLAVDPAMRVVVGRRSEKPVASTSPLYAQAESGGECGGQWWVWGRCRVEVR